MSKANRKLKNYKNLNGRMFVKGREVDFGKYGKYLESKQKKDFE